MTAVDHPRTVSVRMPIGRTFTLDDWISIAAQDSDHTYELVDGKIIIMTPPPSGHAVIVSRLIAWLIRAGYDPDLILADAGLAVGENGRVPDLMVLRKKIPPLTPFLHPGEILLAVEVVSPGSRHDDREVKPIEYAHGGVENYWRVEGYADPDSATVSRYHLDGDRYVTMVSYQRLTDLLTQNPADVLDVELLP